MKSASCSLAIAAMARGTPAADDVPRGALHRLHDDGGDLTAGLVADHVAGYSAQAMPHPGYVQLQRATVAVRVGRQILAGKEGPEVVFEVTAEEPEHAASLAMKPTPEAEHLVLARRGLCEPEGGLDGFGAAGEELDARQAGRGERGEELEEAGARLRGEASEGHTLDLLLQCRHVVRVAVADAADPDTRDEIDVLVAVLVDQRAALAARHGQPRIERERLQARRDMAMLSRDDLA